MNQPPLADRLRPKNFSEFVGQAHLVGSQGVISKLLQTVTQGNSFPSLIFWGPPGSGKTTLARLIAAQLHSPFSEFSAVNTAIKDIEKVIAGKVLGTPLVFIDEIHRFNKAQQDALLPPVERGEVLLIGATTENPSFEVIGPLLSRTRVLVLHQLTEDQLAVIVGRAVKFLDVSLARDARAFLLTAANGDARVALNVLEIASQISPSRALGLAQVEQTLQKRQLTFDLQGEEYYNTISALHKSIRASDPDAALYWLARMLEAGQDPLYIARRLIRAAAEDIGLADPQALVVANAAFEACDKIGMPECNVVLAEAVVYLAKAPKSIAVYQAYEAASADVHQFGNLPVPLKIRNPVTKLMKDLGYGKGYERYPRGKSYLPEKLTGKKYYHPKGDD